MLATMVSPRKSSRQRLRVEVSTRSSPAAKCSFCEQRVDTAGWRQGCCSDSATGTSCTLASTRVRPWRTVCSASGDAPTTRSQAEHRVGLLRIDAHLVQPRRADRPRRTNDSTEPPFCAKPMKSSTLAALAFEVRGHRDHARRRSRRRCRRRR